jgi:hypothetical protein
MTKRDAANAVMLWLEDTQARSQSALAPATNAAGAANVTVWFQDDGGLERGGLDLSAPYSFVITILPVNDPPSFKAGTNVVVLEDAGPQVLTNWATNISLGPPDEFWQTLTLVVSVDRPELFSSAPALTGDGTLTFQFRPNSNGIAHATIWGYDNGGGADAGLHLTSTQSVIITALGVYDPPILTLTAPTNGFIITEGEDITLHASALYIESSLTNVEFFADATRIGADSSAPYRAVWTNVPAGLHVLMALGTDDLGQTTNSALVNVLANARPSVSLTLPTNNSIFGPATTIPVAATASDPDGSISRIDVFDGSLLLSSSASNPFSMSWSNVLPGTQVLSARAVDNFGATKTSSVVTITVQRPPRFNVEGTFALIPDSSLWKYHDVGTNPPSGWRALNFNDSEWPVGAAELGYGDLDEISVIGSMRPITIYFRHVFFVTNRTSLADLTVSLLRDDGAVVYLNEREVFRSNMPTGLITYSTLASAVVQGNEESTFYATNLDLSLLTNGWNVVAVEVHQANASDMSFDLRLFAHPLASAIERISGFPDGSVMLEFQSLIDRTYSIQYSSNLVDWQISMPLVSGSGLLVQWVDSGPPKTSSLPGLVLTRFYRLRLEP